MGYYTEVFKVSCGRCGSSYTIRKLTNHSLKGKWCWDCKKCGARNWCRFGSEQPNIPKELWIGHEKLNQLKVYPIPPGMGNAEWALPFSIRSFIYQMSGELGGCSYEVDYRGQVMNMPTFSDWCRRRHEIFDIFEDSDRIACHLVSGWTKGQESCPLWEKVSLLCQTAAERRFLHQYLGLAKDRHFPMLLPQVRIGIAQRRRPDFVVFVPLQKWKYKWYAIQLDAAHMEETAQADQLRDTEISMHGYEVIKFKPEGKQGYWDDVRRLVEIIEHDMERAESNSWDVATELRVDSTEGGIPF